MRSKVQPPRSPFACAARRAGWILAVLLAAGACRSAPENAAEDTSAREKIQPPAASQFGDPYAVVVNEAPAAPDTPPGLDGETLVVDVRYRGGCADHTFTLQHRTRRDTAHLWLEHDAAGDDCTEMIYEDLRLPLPSGTLDAPIAVLLNPQGGEPFLLKWGP